MQTSKSTINLLQKSTAIVSGILLLSACQHETDDEIVTPSDHYAVITTQADNFTSGDVSIVSLQDYSIDNTNITSLSDTSVSTHGEYFYHINRTPEGNVSKYHIDAPETLISQHAAQETNQDSSNPHALILKDENTGYLIRYGSSSIWVVNPSATNEETYKISEIDLSSYSGEDGTSEATDAILIENKLHVLVQNLENFVPETAYIAIFDTSDNNSEIETNSDNSTPKGVALSVTNPSKMVYLSTNKMLYISGVGPYFPVDYSGGIESLNVTDYSTNVIVDDGDSENHPYGQTTSVAILNSTLGYFVGYSAYQDTALYRFNPTTGEVNQNPLLEHKDISDIEIGPLGNLWVANRSESGISIFNTVDNTLLRSVISTGSLLPNDIEFISINAGN